MCLPVLPLLVAIHNSVGNCGVTWNGMCFLSSMSTGYFEAAVTIRVKILTICAYE